jgi:hypothetical protein
MGAGGHLLSLGRSAAAARIDHHHHKAYDVVLALAKPRSQCRPSAQRPGKQPLFRHLFRTGTDDSRNPSEGRKPPFSAGPYQL